MSACDVAAPRPHATRDQTISCTKYDPKPVTDPAIAMPLLAATEPVNKNPISIIEKNPEICHVIDLVKSLTVLSMGYLRNGY